MRFLMKKVMDGVDLAQFPESREREKRVDEWAAVASDLGYSRLQTGRIKSNC